MAEQVGNPLLSCHTHDESLDAELSRTHNLWRCPHCHHWAIWEPKGARGEAVSTPQSRTAVSSLDVQCPRCHRVMVVRTNTKNGSEFLGCSGWPDECRETMPLPAYLEVKRAGGQPLPGFD